MSSRPPGAEKAERRVLSWNCNRSCGTGAAIGHSARWVGKWIGVFSVAALIEADSGFDQTVSPNWAEFTEHTVTERRRPLQSRTLRAVVHRDSRQASHVSPGDGRFLICNETDLLTVFVHLPVINNDSESEVLHEQTLSAVSKVS